MGGMAFGPWGAVGGGVLGAVETALDLLGQSAKEAAAAVQEWAGLVKNAAAIDKSYTKTMFQESVPGMSVMQLDTEIAARERTRADSKYGI